jgi:hypothetical protein
VVRLRSVTTGVVVETTEENAARLGSAFEPVESKTAKRSSSRFST